MSVDESLNTHQAYDHLIHIQDHSDVALYELIPDAVWFFDLDKHGWWWGNSAAVKFWGLNHVDELINKDLSGDTQGAKDRTAQTFELAAQNGLTIDPWTTYPNGKPKTIYMRHRAVLLGPDKHRGLIAFINEEVNLGETPENLLLVEAMRYTSVAVTSFTYDGEPVVENPEATEAYKHISRTSLPDGQTFFSARFVDAEEGKNILSQAIENKGGEWTSRVNTSKGERIHSLDVRITRHPLSGDFLLLMSEYDVTPLHDALDSAENAKEELRHLAHYDAVTGIPSLRYLMDQEQELMTASRANGCDLSVFYIDLDGFKGVNDSYGHKVGDEVLTTIAQCLSHAVKSEGNVVRLGGDEFLVWLSGKHDYSNIVSFANVLLDLIKQPISTSAKCDVTVSASIGVALHQSKEQTLEGIIQRADKAMYAIKRADKCGVYIEDISG